MVEAYWEIGKSIVEKQGGNATAEYGTNLLKELSKQMTADFGKGFTVTNLSYMRQFYLTFPNHHALRDKLSWTHYRMIKVKKDKTPVYSNEEKAAIAQLIQDIDDICNRNFFDRFKIILGIGT